MRNCVCVSLLGLCLALLAPAALASSGVYYFTGSPADQATKTANDVGTATFSATAPTGAVPITQTGTAFANADYVGNWLAFYWTGSYSGPATGTLDLNWYWSSQVASAVGGFVEISVFADPDYTAAERAQPEKLIGRALMPLVGIGATPTLVHTQIPVNGYVNGTLLIQACPHYIVNDSELFVHYGSTDYPSRFQFLDQARTPFPAAPLGSGLGPRFKVTTPSASQLAAGIGSDAGEPSIGSNWLTGNALFLSLNTVFRVGFDDSCPTTPSGTWTSTGSPFTSVTSLDPILFTDKSTGRTFVSELLANPLVSSSAVTDNDGASWLPSQGAGIGSGVDHQTIGGGPFHAPVPTGATYPNAVYYCSQDIAEAGCALSLDGGLTYGPAVPIYAGTCVGLHGHIKVGPDGTAYVPNKGCGENQAIIVSENNGMTWDIRKVPHSMGADSDPSVAISRGGRVYFGFMDNNNDPVVAVSDDRGHSWYNVQNVAPSVHNGVFPAMVAGDDNRAALAFLGTPTTGSLQARTFPGVWHMYVSATYDGGRTWIPVNATPNDPVQRGPIWLAGGAEISRNLLDFNDATIDKQGRILVGYADGCVGPCVGAAAASRGNAYTEVSSIARQSGGRRMFPENDPAEPTAPGAPTLTVARNGGIARLAWSEGNDGGSAITNYAVYRRGATGAAALVGNAGTATSYVDATADPNTTYTWSVTAKNALGSSCGSNDVTAAPAGSSCSAPGVTVVTDATGDQNGAPANAALDIQSVSVSEPYYADGSQKIVFTIKVASLASLPPLAEWRVIWNFPTGDSGQYYADMRTDQNGAVSFEYGNLVVTGAVVTSVAQPNTLGAAEPESSYNSDGTIRIVLANGKLTATTDAGPQAGDLIGGLIGRTYILAGTQVTSSRTQIDGTKVADTYLLVGNAFCAPPALTCYEDDDAHIAYSGGWHLVSDTDATAGHFRLANGKAKATLTLNVPANQFGAVTYSYATSPKGGSAEIFIDGVSQGVISFSGATGSTKAPTFGASKRFAGLQGGAHTFEIRGDGLAYLDKICLESSSSNAQPDSGPSATSSSSATAIPGTDVVTQLIVPANALSVAAMAEGPSGVPIRIVLVDPMGLSVATATSNAAGIASFEQPVTAGGVYLVKVTNLSAGPVSVWTAATPQVKR